MERCGVWEQNLYPPETNGSGVEPHELEVFFISFSIKFKTPILMQLFRLKFLV